MLTAKQVREWIAYSRLEPFGPMVDRAYAGAQVASVYNVNRGKDGDPLSWMDIFPPYDDDEKPGDDTPQVSPIAKLYSKWADMLPADREKRWGELTDAERDEFSEIECAAVLSYMNMHMVDGHEPSAEERN